jgi:hypothetical protein
MIVIDGELFEVSYDGEGQKLNLERKNHIRLRWKGNADYSFNSIIDVVTKSHLEEFLSDRLGEMQIIRNVMGGTTSQLSDIYAGTRPVDELNVTEGPRGMLGRPGFITELIRYLDEKRESKK